MNNKQVSTTITDGRLTELKNVKKGAFIRLIRDGEPCQRVYIKDYYERASKKYCIYAFDDVCAYRLVNASTIVLTDFIF